jgi:hypothetical protein
MKNLIKYLSISTFFLSSATIASIFYEGMVLRWFSFVGILIPATDIFFLVATIAGIFYYKKHKTLFYCHLLSVLTIIIGIIITLIYGKEMPKILFLLWEFYILYFYSIVVIKKLWQKKLVIRN